MSTASPLGYIGEGKHASNVYVENLINTDALTVRSGFASSPKEQPNITDDVTLTYDDSGSSFNVDGLPKLVGAGTTLTVTLPAPKSGVEFFIIIERGNTAPGIEGDYIIDSGVHPMYGIITSSAPLTASLHVVDACNVVIDSDDAGMLGVSHIHLRGVVRSDGPAWHISGVLFASTVAITTIPCP